MSKKRGRRHSKFFRYIKSPFRALARARDLYVKSLTGCDGQVSFGNAMGCPTPQIPSLPRSLSVNSSHPHLRSADEELRDLMIRLSLTGKIEAELRRSKSSMPGGSGGGVVLSLTVPRSNTVVAFGRIDEEKPLEFGDEDEKVGLLGGVYPRSRSSRAVARRIKVA